MNPIFQFCFDPCIDTIVSSQLFQFTASVCHMIHSSMIDIFGPRTMFNFKSISILLCFTLFDLKYQKPRISLEPHSLYKTATIALWC